MDKNAPSTKQMRKDGAHEHPRDGAGLQQSEPEADSGPSQDALLAAFDLNSDCDDATFFSQLDWNKMIAAMTSFSQEVRRAKGSPDPDPQEVAVELAKMVLEMEAEIGLEPGYGKHAIDEMVLSCSQDASEHSKQVAQALTSEFHKTSRPSGFDLDPSAAAFPTGPPR